MKRIQQLSLVLFTIAAVVSNHNAEAAHLDIVPYFERDESGSYQFSVGRFDFNKTSQALNGLPPAAIERNVLVFTGAFSVRPSDGRIVNGDPGWDLPPDVVEFEGIGAEYPAGTLPPRGGRLKFNVVADPRLGRNLSYWDGTGTPSFGPVPGGEVLDIFEPTFISPDFVTLDGANASFPGFELTTSPLGPGNFHTHTSHVLWGDASRSGTPEDPPTPGFYLLSFNMEIEGGHLWPNFPEFTGIVSGIHAVSPTFHVILAHGFANGDDEYIYGDPLYDPRGHFLTDENGENVEDEFGNWIWVPELDEFGAPIFDPVLDEFGNPVLEVFGVGDFILAPEMQLAVNWVNTNLASVPEPTSVMLALLGVIPAFRITGRRRQ